MIKLSPTAASETAIIDFTPLSVLQLQLVAQEIVENLIHYRPEFARLVRLQQNAGTRVNELFQPYRWSLVDSSTIHLQPQKGNALRVLQLSEIGVASAAEMQVIKQDMARLPKRQYERAFALCVTEAGLWRKYENGFLHPSTHMLRHLKIKMLKNSGNSVEYISTWIGEKSVENLDYYLNSEYYL